MQKVVLNSERDASILKNVVETSAPAIADIMYLNRYLLTGK
ncbi:hypothetical protein QEG73_06985 [Chitinophagaceae bacterium 26-R-25]|nr:hypothetical protein [Chitinophagaceae bacterium 26-R-25]